MGGMDGCWRWSGGGWVGWGCGGGETVGFFPGIEERFWGFGVGLGLGRHGEGGEWFGDV